MKLMRIGDSGAEKPAIMLDDGRVADISGFVSEIDGAWLASGGPDALRAKLAGGTGDFPIVDISNTRIGPPMARPAHILAIGLNYADHAKEAGMEIPDQPIVFTKAPASYCGPNDDVPIPPGSKHTDWEVELGFVIGKTASYLPNADNALDHVAGYCVVNDVSERAWQFNFGPTWIKGKSAINFCPTGPWLVTADEVPDPQNLSLKLSVNGESRQDGSTKTMIFGVAHLVHYLSQFMVLEPGDLVTTGTPPGVGSGMKPPQYLKAGDVMALEINGLGAQQQRLI